MEKQEFNNYFAKIFIPLLIFIIPLFFLTSTVNFYEFNKMLLLFLASVVLLLIFALSNFFGKSVSFSTTPLDLPVFIFLVAVLASTFFASPNRILPFAGKTGIILSLTAFYFALVQARVANWRTWLQALIASSFMLSWVMIFAFMQILGKILPLEVVKSQIFTPTGNLLALVSVQVILLPIIVIFGLKTNQFLNKILYFLIGALNLVAIVMAISLMFPGKPSQLSLLPYQFGWWIAVEIFKQLKTALVGVGPENFLTAFTRFHPAAFNTSNFWNLRFINSSNELFQILTTLGLLGISAFIYLLSKAGKILTKHLKKDDFNFALKLSFGLILICFLLVPANFLVFFILYLILALVAKQFSTQKTYAANNLTKIIFIVTVVGLGSLAFFAGRLWLAEKRYKESLDAAQANKGLETYNKQIEAIKLNPFQEKYRVSHSQINLALANSLAAKKDLTDADKNNITQLVSQAISEAKAAATLNPSNAIYWENLANLYKSLINFATGAADWATAAYIQAIQLDPVNPSLRVQLGGLFYALNNWDGAADQFKRAIDLKPDFANAYYNLAWVYRQKKDNKLAYQTMQQVISLTPQDTDDFTKASQELEELRQLLPEEERMATSSAQKKEKILTPPQALPSPRSAGPINLPKNAGLEVSPAPSPSAHPSASPVATPKP